MRWDIASFIVAAAGFLLQLIDFIIDKLSRRKKPKHKSKNGGIQILDLSRFPR